MTKLYENEKHFGSSFFALMPVTLSSGHMDNKLSSLHQLLLYIIVDTNNTCILVL